jgi:dipeptidyl aminopeptidase/acylaminoacyl peptidase
VGKRRHALRQAGTTYEKFNPVDHVKTNGASRMLVVQGGKDFRIPAGPRPSAFTALQRKGMPSKLLYFPNENHWVLKAQNSVQWHNEVLEWLDQWTKGQRRTSNTLINCGYSPLPLV